MIDVLDQDEIKRIVVAVVSIEMMDVETVFQHGAQPVCITIRMCL